MISRQSFWFKKALITLTTSSSTTPEIDFREAAGGTIFAIDAIVSFTVYGTYEPGGTYFQLYDSSNAAISRTVTQGKAYALPDECFGCRAIRIVANTGGTVQISLKG